MSNFCHLLKNVKETDWAKKIQWVILAQMRMRIFFFFGLREIFEDFLSQKENFRKLSKSAETESFSRNIMYSLISRKDW